MAQALRVCLLGLSLALASSLQIARADARIFALVVTSNRGISIAQPPLAYADDDGARYFQLFRASAKSADDVVLLTSFDAATRAAYPGLEGKARAPLRAELTAAIAELASRVRAAAQAGEETVFYFVFAGHGEVREGRGYLGLEDSAIDGGFIEHELVERVPAGTKHILLDSCNSFFVVNPRKPGGRRWATPKDMAFGFSARHPEVGVFLSTNAEEEVYEWSKLESGVFSHEVRSGMRGGADVDRDGRVSYSELAGFVTRANAGIPRESLRPHLFFRGPEGKRDATFFRVSALRGVRLGLDAAEMRMWLADERGERVLDLHKEQGPLTVVAPDEQGALTLFAARAGDTQSTPSSYLVQPEQGTLTPTSVELAARGDQLFGALFSQPYGQQAHAAFERQERERPMDVFGLSEMEIERVESLLDEIAGESRVTRNRWGSFALGAGLVPLGLLVAQLAAGRYDWSASEYVAFSGLALLGEGIGLSLLLRPSEGQRVQSALRPYLVSKGRMQRAAFIEASEALAELDRKMRRARRWTGGVMLALALSCGAFSVYQFIDRDDEITGAVFAGAGAVTLAMAGFKAFTLSSEERLIRLYQRDPQLSLQFAANLSASGGSAGLLGRF